VLLFREHRLYCSIASSIHGVLDHQVCGLGFMNLTRTDIDLLGSYSTPVQAGIRKPNAPNGNETSNPVHSREERFAVSPREETKCVQVVINIQPFAPPDSAASQCASCSVLTERHYPCVMTNTSYMNLLALQKPISKENEAGTPSSSQT
jgi:hypothetical protein